MTADPGSLSKVVCAVVRVYSRKAKTGAREVEVEFIVSRYSGAREEERPGRWSEASHGFSYLNVGVITSDNEIWLTVIVLTPELGPFASLLAFFHINHYET